MARLTERIAVIVEFDGDKMKVHSTESTACIDSLRHAGNLNTFKLSVGQKAVIKAALEAANVLPE